MGQPPDVAFKDKSIPIKEGAKAGGKGFGGVFRRWPDQVRWNVPVEYRKDGPETAREGRAMT